MMYQCKELSIFALVQNFFIMGKQRTERTRNAGTMTESAFFGMIRAALRSKSRWWKPILMCKQTSRRLYKGTNKRQKYEYQCNVCKEWFKDKDVNVDHIIPCGSLNSFADLPGFVERLFIESDGLQVICSGCHNEKTKEEWKTSRSQTKKEDGSEEPPKVKKKKPPTKKHQRKRNSQTKKSQSNSKLSQKRSLPPM